MKKALILGMLLISNSVFSQISKRQTEYVKKTVPTSNTQIKMVVLDDNNKAISTDTATLNQLQVPEKEKFIIQYDTKINEVKESQLSPKLTEAFITPKEWKIVPEILSSKQKGSDAIIAYQIYFTSVQPFKYDQDSMTFKGKLGFVLIDIADGSIVKDLNEPAYIEVNSEEIDQIRPEKLSVAHLNLPSSEITLSEKHGSDSLKLKIITKNNLAGYDTYIKVEPTLKISSETNNIMSLGVEKALIDVRMIGSSTEDSVLVSFSSESGEFIPDQLTLKHNELKKVELRSGYKLGNVQVSAIGKGAQSTNYESNRFEIKYVFPWLFILFSMAGGIVGSVIRFRKKISLKKVLLATIDGLAACIIYFILKVPIPQLGELESFGAVVFGVGILGGFATITGIFPYIKTLVNREVPKGEANP